MSNDNEKNQLVQDFKKTTNTTSQSFQDTKSTVPTVISPTLKKSPNRTVAAHNSKKKKESSHFTYWEQYLRCLCDSLCEMNCQYGCDWGNCCEAALLCNCSSCTY